MLNNPGDTSFVHPAHPVSATESQPRPKALRLADKIEKLTGELALASAELRGLYAVNQEIMEDFALAGQKLSGAWQEASNYPSNFYADVSELRGKIDSHGLVLKSDPEVDVGPYVSWVLEVTLANIYADFNFGKEPIDTDTKEVDGLTAIDALRKLNRVQAASAVAK